MNRQISYRALERMGWTDTDRQIIIVTFPNGSTKARAVATHTDGRHCRTIGNSKAGSFGRIPYNLGRLLKWRWLRML